MASQIKKVIEKSRNNFKQNPQAVYFKFWALVEQARNARIISDAIWKYHGQLIYHKGEINNVTNYSRVALENFAVSELWKLFDKKSAFNIWEVTELLNKPSLSTWLETNFKKVESDKELVHEWRGDAIGHRGKAGFYAQEMRVVKFKNGRVSEQRLRNFLVDFLSHIFQELFGTDISDATNAKLEMRASENNFKKDIEKEMKEIFKEYDGSK